MSPHDPEGGSQRSCTAKTRMSTSPTQYTGNEMPRYAPRVRKRSTQPPGRQAP